MSDRTQYPTRESPLAAYKILGRHAGLRVSPICLGTANFGDKWKETWGEMNKEETHKILDYYVSKGGNFIDTADMYQEGQSEEYIGEFLKKKGIRDDVVLASKFSIASKYGSVNMAGNHRKNMLYSVDRSLHRLQTHYLDLLYIHVWDYTTSVDEVLRAADDLVRSGKVHYLAISDAPAWKVSQANTIASLKGWSQFVAYQGLYHPGERDLERDVLPMAQELGVSFIPWGVLGQGKFTGKFKRGDQGIPGRGSGMTEKDYNIADVVVKIAEETKATPSQVVTNWALTRASKWTTTIPILGTRNVDQLESNIKALEFQLTPEQVKTIDDVSGFDLGFPHNFLGGTDYHHVKWIKMAGFIQ